MNVVGHGALYNFAVHVFRIVFEHHVQVLLGRDLRFGGHLWEA
jgi:hypothetical protein